MRGRNRAAMGGNEAARGAGRGNGGAGRRDRDGGASAPSRWQRGGGQTAATRLQHGCTTAATRLQHGCNSKAGRGRVPGDLGDEVARAEVVGDGHPHLPGRVVRATPSAVAAGRMPLIPSRPDSPSHPGIPGEVIGDGYLDLLCPEVRTAPSAGGRPDAVRSESPRQSEASGSGRPSPSRWASAHPSRARPSRVPLVTSALLRAASRLRARHPGPAARPGGPAFSRRLCGPGPRLDRGSRDCVPLLA
jgi:hypothetical protein